MGLKGWEGASSVGFDLSFYLGWEGGEGLNHRDSIEVDLGFGGWRSCAGL